MKDMSVFLKDTANKNARHVVMQDFASSFKTNV